ncbi:MAG: hydantoinase/oxoprolinase family protein [Thermoplasmata archaeon]
MGVDIGGTFTDLVISDARGRVRIIKVLTTPDDLQQAILQGIAEAGIEPREIDFFAHATTQGSNALVERKGAVTSLLTTEGFRDVLEIRRGQRAINDPRDTYNLDKDLPQDYVGGRGTLVPRARRWTVAERVDATGVETIPLDEEGVRRAARAMRADGTEAVAVSFLFSFLRPSHEQHAAEILREELPGIPVSTSSDVLPVIREYERTSTTVVNAFIQPKVRAYLERLESELAARGFSGGVNIMQSHGGIMTSTFARERPVYLLESGPAAGVAAVEWLGRQLGVRHLLSLDVGGTTAKVCIVRDYRAETTTNFWIGDDHFVGIPVTDLVEIGAGGGTLARLDAGGALRVGPESAGSSPGPACYGLGGSAPTVTDANLLLGYLDPEYFLGGQMRLDRGRAERVMEERVGRPLGRSAESAALGVIQIVNANMTSSMRVVSVERGYDPRDFALVGFGGSGPLHAGALASEAGIPTVVYPRIPGNFSALGLLVSDLKVERMRSLVGTTRTIDLATLGRTWTLLEQEVTEDLLRQGAARRKVRLHRALAMRYQGQAHELPIAAPSGRFTDRSLREVERRFHAQHEQHYAYRDEAAQVEIITLRLLGSAAVPRPRPERLPSVADPSPSVARKGERRAYSAEEGRFVRTAVYDRARLRPGHRIRGPALVEQLDTTLVLPAGSDSRIDRFGNLLATLGKRPRRRR